MKHVTLTRFAYSPVGTFGILEVSDTGFKAFSVERPWVDENNDSISDRNVSCIPEGSYPLTLVPDDQTRVTTAGLPAYVVNRVLGRSGIMIHIAQSMEDVKGCVGLGTELGMSKGKWGVLNSTVAYKQFMAAMGGAQNATLSVRFTWNRPKS